MRSIELNNLVRKDIPLSYRRSYSADALVTGRNTGESIHAIEFDLESSPLGTVDISVRFAKKPAYPTLPLVQDLKTAIARLDEQGKLP